MTLRHLTSTGGVTVTAAVAPQALVLAGNGACAEAPETSAIALTEPQNAATSLDFVDMNPSRSKPYPRLQVASLLLAQAQFSSDFACCGAVGSELIDQCCIVATPR